MRGRKKEETELVGVGVEPRKDPMRSRVWICPKGWKRESAENILRIGLTQRRCFRRRLMKSLLSGTEVALLNCTTDQK